MIASFPKCDTLSEISWMRRGQRTRGGVDGRGETILCLCLTCGSSGLSPLSRVYELPLSTELRDLSCAFLGQTRA